MHADIVHLLSNLLVLFVFGFALEEEIGWRKTLLIFILGAFAGQLFSVFYYAPNIVSVGASAGIFSLIGAGMLVAPFSFKLPNPVPLGLVGIYNIIGFLSGPSEISYIAHFGGLFIGLVYGFYKRGIKHGMGIIILLSIILLILMLAVPLIILQIF